MNDQNSLDKISFQEQADYEIRNKALSHDVAITVEELCGPQDFAGDQPFEVKIADASNQLAYIIRVRKGHGWISIQRQVSDNPSLVKIYLLEQKDGSWSYDDAYMIKYHDSSPHELEEVHNLLKVALKTSGSKQLADPKLIE